MTRHVANATALGETLQPATHVDVLVVDDEPAVRKFLTRYLEKAGYVVRSAGSAVEAVEIMAERPAVLVLCDIRMPEHDGLWLAACLHARWPDTPFIMASTIDDVGTIRQSRQVGAVDYVTKPIATEQLLEVVRRAKAAHIDARPGSSAGASADFIGQDDERADAEYALETPVRCPACSERIATLRAIRLVRSHVNFVSTLPRRGHVLACPHCLAVIPGELTNF